MKKQDDLEKRVAAIENRNSKVAADKAWETSFTRRLLLIIFTYLAIGFYLNAINVANPWLNAIVPALGFLFSTLTIPYFKSFWLKYFYKK